MLEANDLAIELAKNSLYTKHAQAEKKTTLVMKNHVLIINSSLLLRAALRTSVLLITSIEVSTDSTVF